jgi:endonuclease/exonuclease/phosphatase family metal-dependent hydrolase
MKIKTIILLILTGVLLHVQSQTIALKVMTMNIKEGGKYAGYNATAFANCIKTYNPDFVVFQELDNYTTRNGNQDFLSQIAVSTGMFPYFAKAITYSNGDFGNGILSKYPFFNARNVSFKPTGASEERNCAWIDVMLPSKKKVRIAVTHLDVSNEQIRVSSVAIINNNLLVNNNMPTLLSGDFNATPSSETLSYALLKWQDIGTGTGNTIPSTGPTSRIDYVLGYPKTWVKKSYEIVCYPDLSDHCFVVTQVEYNN